jgi:hypothetical protein
MFAKVKAAERDEAPVDLKWQRRLRDATGERNVGARGDQFAAITYSRNELMRTKGEK